MRNRKGIQVLAAFSFMAVLSACASDKRGGELTAAAQTVPGATKWGHFDGEPVTKWNPDGRTMTLLSDLRYTDPQGLVWIAPAGSQVDGASIPRSLWSIMGGPFEGKYRNASVLHDVAYEQHNRPWQDCDRMFYNAMRCSGASAVEAKTMYYALYRFGHHWKFPIKRAKAVKVGGTMVARAVPRAVPANVNEVYNARDWIRRAEPSLEQIEQRADAEAW